MGGGLVSCCVGRVYGADGAGATTCAHHQEVKIALHSLLYHHTYRCDDTN